MNLHRHSAVARAIRFAPLLTALVLAACGSEGSGNNDQREGLDNLSELAEIPAGEATNDGTTNDATTSDGNGSDGNGSDGGGTAVQAVPVRGADSQILLEWPAFANAESYNVYYDTTETFDAATAVLLNDSVGVITGTSAMIPGLTNGVTYRAWFAPIVSGTEGTLVPLGEATPSAGGLGVSSVGLEPPLNAVEVNPNKTIRIPFGSVLEPATVTSESVKITVGNVAQAVSINLVDGGQTIEVTPVGGAWQAGATYTVEVLGSIESATGDPLRNPLKYTFRVLDTAALVAWWEFDNSLVDLSGNGNTIDTNQGVTFADAAALHRSGTHAAYFNGSSYLVLNDTTFDLGSRFSVATWVYIPTLRSNINTILSNAAANEATSGFKIGVNNWLALDGRVILEGGNGSQGGKAVTASGFVQDGQWYHFAYNIDTTANLPNGRHVQIFFNGVEADVDYESSGAMATMDWSMMKTTGPLFIGAMVGASYRLNGAYLDDMRIYNRVLTAGEIVNIAR